MARIAPLCVVLPPLCVGMVGFGAALGANQFDTSQVPQGEANRLAAIVASHATNEKLRSLVNTSEGAQEQPPEFPVLVLRISGVLLVPTRDGVTFRVAATAQGSPAAGQEWEPSVHFTQLPSRPLDEWLVDDGAQLKSDLDMALRVLAKHIVPTYLPYAERGGR